MGNELRCYVICAVPRTGSWLLCHALEDSGLAGHPAEYFWRGDEAFWRERWGVQNYGDYLDAFRTTATPNGLAGVKIMWGYLFDFLDKARTLPHLKFVPQEELIEAVLPGTAYLWIRRRDKLRQAISWWRAEATGEWARPTGADGVTGPKRLDLAAVTNLLHVAVAHEQAWRSHFETYGIRPWTVDYEDLVADVDGVLNSALSYLGVHPGRSLRAGRARIERQADDRTEEWVADYLAAEAAGQLDTVVPVARTPVGEDPMSLGARHDREGSR